MSIEDDNIEVLRKAYQRWTDSKGADRDCWLDVIAEQIDFRSLADGRPAVDFTCPRADREGVRGYLDGLLKQWEMESFEVQEFIAQGERVVVISDVAWRNVSTGKAVECVKVDIWRLRDGQAVGFHEFYDTERMTEAATP